MAALGDVRRALLNLRSKNTALLVSMSGLTGCGSDSQSGQANEPKTAAGTYSFNVVATSGSATSTATYKLTVQ